MRNGEDHVPSDEMTPILPHPDGTYQIRVSVEVPTKEGDTYFCHVDHSSLGDETLSVKWDPPKDNTPIIIGVVVVAVALIIGAVIGVVIYRKRSVSGQTPADRNIYVPAPNNEENAPNSSNN
ncbi:unnamed protein product [Staurois parvus]|uniref:Immunoglobulin C1-set domain-containing protein n=1 Tax=Staurois parvus TaxID=386267 RepID=A0ABN9BIL7_9NEOB|nr:unnamed protein product [Staurois parvus]